MESGLRAEHQDGAGEIPGRATRRCRLALLRALAAPRDRQVSLLIAPILRTEIARTRDSRADSTSRGDPYTAEVAATVHAVMTKLNFSNQSVDTGSLQLAQL